MNSRSRTSASIAAATCTVRQEVGNHDSFPTLRDSGVQTHLDERPVDEVTQSEQAAIEQGARGPRQAHAAFLDRRDGKDRRADQVPELVREKAQTLVRGPRRFVELELIALASELRDGIGDRIVEAPVERVEVGRGDGRVLFDGQLGDGLAEISVVVDDLAHGEPAP